MIQHPAIQSSQILQESMVVANAGSIVADSVLMVESVPVKLMPESVAVELMSESVPVELVSESAPVELISAHIPEDVSAELFVGSKRADNECDGASFDLKISFVNVDEMTALSTVASNRRTSSVVPLTKVVSVVRSEEDIQSEMEHARIVEEYARRKRKEVDSTPGNSVKVKDHHSVHLDDINRMKRRGAIVKRDVGLRTASPVGLKGVQVYGTNLFFVDPTLDSSANVAAVVVPVTDSVEQTLEACSTTTNSISASNNRRNRRRRRGSSAVQLSSKDQPRKDVVFMDSWHKNPGNIEVDESHEPVVYAEEENNSDFMGEFRSKPFEGDMNATPEDASRSLNSSTNQRKETFSSADDSTAVVDDASYNFLQEHNEAIVSTAWPLVSDPNASTEEEFAAALVFESIEPATKQRVDSGLDLSWSNVGLITDNNFSALTGVCDELGSWTQHNDQYSTATTFHHRDLTNDAIQQAARRNLHSAPSARTKYSANPPMRPRQAGHNIDGRPNSATISANRDAKLHALLRHKQKLSPGCLPPSFRSSNIARYVDLLMKLGINKEAVDEFKRSARSAVEKTIVEAAITARVGCATDMAVANNALPTEDRSGSDVFSDDKTLPSDQLTQMQPQENLVSFYDSIDLSWEGWSLARDELSTRDYNPNKPVSQILESVPAPNNFEGVRPWVEKTRFSAVPPAVPRPSSAAANSSQRFSKRSTKLRQSADDQIVSSRGLQQGLNHSPYLAGRIPSRPASALTKMLAKVSLSKAESNANRTTTNASNVDKIISFALSLGPSDASTENSSIEVLACYSKLVHDTRFFI